MQAKYKGEAALFLNTIIWGGTFIIIKNALQDISPMSFITLRFFIAGLILLPFIKRIFKDRSREVFIGGGILGLLYFAGFAVQTIGLNYTSATKSGFITGTFVVFVPFLQMLIEKRTPGKGNIIGIILVLIGLILLSGKGDSLFSVFTEIGSNFNIGDTLTLICAVLFAMYIVYLDIISKKVSYMPLVFMQIAITGIGGFLLALILSSAGIERFGFTLNGNVIFAVLYTTILATLVTTTLQTRFQRFVSPTKAGIIFSLEPIFAAIFAFLIAGERIGSFGVFGGIFIFAGLLASEIIDKKKEDI
jgi:drug/metabolite transporter (DMT)-like permease